MKGSADWTGPAHGSRTRENQGRVELPLQLRYQWRWAALLLYGSWLLTLTAGWSLAAPHPVRFTAFLPGLAVAIYLERVLARHLVLNHPPLEETRLFATLGTANWISLVRGCGIVLLAGFLPRAFFDPQAGNSPWIWAPGIIYLTISLADLLDGYAARKQHHETQLGKILDVEADAAGLLTASLLAVSLGRLPPAYLLAGLAYYAFSFGTWLRKRRSLVAAAWQPRPYARIIAGCQMGLVAMVLLPLFQPTFSLLAGYLFMTPLLLGFFRDWLVVSGRLATDGRQRAAIDGRSRQAIEGLGPMLRLLVLAGCIPTLAEAIFTQDSLLWTLPYGICCLLTILGIVGRSSSLVLIVLLGSTGSPLGESLPALTVFIGATVLLLIGPGRLSLWDPEEYLLYRRWTEEKKQPCRIG